MFSLKAFDNDFINQPFLRTFASLSASQSRALPTNHVSAAAYQSLHQPKVEISSTAIAQLPEKEAKNSESNEHLSRTKQLVQKYGSLVWKTYWGVYFGALGGLFCGVQTGILDPLVLLGGGGSSAANAAEYAVGFMQGHSWLAPYAPWVEKSPMIANFVLAWLIAEACEPLRIAATCALVPNIAARRTPKEDKKDENETQKSHRMQPKLTGG